MPYTLDSLSTEEDYFYIAQLLHHIGIGVEMVYGPYSSLSYSGMVGSALRGYFRYNCDVYKQKNGNGNPYSNEEWAQMLKNGGLDEHLPLFYSGSDDNSGAGHAFVCDGYDENDYFHFNWGLSDPLIRRRRPRKAPNTQPLPQLHRPLCRQIRHQSQFHL